MAYFTALTLNQKFILLLCLICFIYGVAGIVDGFLSSNVKSYILGLFSCAAIIAIAAIILTENKRTDLTQVQAVMKENKSDIYIDGYSLKTGDVYINHGKLYIEKGE